MYIRSYVRRVAQFLYYNIPNFSLFNASSLLNYLVIEWVICYGRVNRGNMRYESFFAPFGK